MERKSFNTERGHFSFLHWHKKSSQPPILFIHATGFNALTYRTNLEQVSAEFEIFALDLRGHGFSNASADPHDFDSWDIYIQDILSFLKMLPTPIILAGHSLGSMLCLAIAAKYPEQVKHLLMIEPIIMTPRQCKLWALTKWFGLGNRIEIASKAKKRRYIFDSRQHILNSYTGKGAFKTWPKEVLKDYIDGGTKVIGSEGKVQLTCHPDWESRSFALTAHETWKWLKLLQVPNRLIYADHSSTISENSISIIHKDYPFIKTSMYHATHFVPMEKKDSLLSELLLLRSTLQV